MNNIRRKGLTKEKTIVVCRSEQELNKAGLVREPCTVQRKWGVVKKFNEQIVHV